MEECNFKKSYFTIMIICLSVAFVFLVFGYFASEGFAQRSYQQNIEEGQQSKSGRNHLARLDTDGDGKISQDEFPGPGKHFTKLDQDQDGYLSESELPKGPPKCKKGDKRKRRSFSSLDKDNDGKLSQEEFPGPDDHFTKFDKDKDGYLDESEMPKGPPRGEQRS